MRRYLWLAILALVLVAVTGCRPIAATAPQLSQQPRARCWRRWATHRRRQLPSTTDWAAIKAATGVTGPLPADGRMDFFILLTDAYATPSLFTQRNIGASGAAGAGTPAISSGRRPAPMAHRLTPSSSRPASICRRFLRATDLWLTDILSCPHGFALSHEIAMGADWVQTELAFSNSAFLPEERIGLFWLVSR